MIRNFNSKKLFLFNLLMLITIIGWTIPNKYYVSTTGSNSNNGTSATPFLTITQAVSTASGGDTIVVQPGTYRETIDMLGKNLVLTKVLILVEL